MDLSEDRRVLRGMRPLKRKTSAKTGAPLELEDDWRVLKGLPQYAYVLDQGLHLYVSAMALHRVKVLSKTTHGGWPGYIVRLDKTLWKEAHWRRNTKTPSRTKPQFIDRRVLATTRSGVERLFVEYHRRLHEDMYREVCRLHDEAVQMAAQLGYHRRALDSMRGAHSIRAVIEQVPRKKKV